MESVPPAIIIIFVILFAMLTFTGAMLSTQDSMRELWRDAQSRQAKLAQTSLTLVRGQVTSEGTQVEFTVRNTGSARLADFDRWDVFVQFYDNAMPTGYHIARLPYQASDPAPNQWTLDGLFLNAEKELEEVYDPGILNPDEESVIRLKILPAMGSHKTLALTIATSGGTRVSTYITRDEPPVMVRNNRITVNSGQTKSIEAAHLFFTDPDNAPADLTYTVVSSPQRGKLSLGHTFTQAAIDAGLLTYTHDGGMESADRFEFTLSDGTTTLGPYIFEFAINQPPALETNSGLTIVQGGNAAIAPTHLKATDPDNTAANLVYTVTSGPTQGTLNMTTFTQKDIDEGRVTYTHTGSGPDQLEFTVTDGNAVIGPFTFRVVVP